MTLIWLVGRLRAAEDEVVLQLLQRGGDHRAGLHRARPVDRIVDDVHGLVGTHRQRLADGVGGRVGPDGQHGDLAALRIADGAAPPRWRTRPSR